MLTLAPERYTAGSCMVLLSDKPQLPLKLYKVLSGARVLLVFFFYLVFFILRWQGRCKMK